MGASVRIRRWVTVLVAGLVIGAGLAPASGADAGGAIRGTLAIPDGSSHDTVRVVAYRKIPDCCGGWRHDQKVGTVGVDASGAYAFTGLEPGKYVLRADDTASLLYFEYWSGWDIESGLSPIVPVTAGGTAVAPIGYMALGATVEGTVSSDIAGGSTEGILVSVIGPSHGQRPMFSAQGWALVRADGTYRITGLPACADPSPCYYLEFEDPDGWFVKSHWNFGTGTDLTLDDGESVKIGDHRVEAAGKISGRVLLPAGVGSGLHVTAYRPSSSDPDAGWVSVDGPYAYEDGVFTISALPAGRYRLRFHENFDAVVPEWFRDSTTPEGAVDVIVEAGQTTDGIVADLRPDGYQPPVPALEPIWVTRHPRVKGKTVVGRTLRVTRGEWAPSTVTLSHQWFVRKAGRTVRLRAATRPSLRLTKALLGKRVRVRVTASKSGHRTATFRSEWTSRVTGRGSRP